MAIAWPQRSIRTYRRIEKEKKPYEISFMKGKLLILPGVVSPKYTADSRLYSAYLPKVVRRSRLLEIGTGTGITAIACALNGARVVATDLNKNAVRNCRLNAKRYKVSIDIRKGSVYAPIREGERFDFIYWNHPWYFSKRTTKDLLMKGAFDYKFESTENFVRGAKSFLSPNGVVLIGTVDIPDTMRRLRGFAKKYGYSIRILKRINKRLEDPEDVFVMRLVVFELRPKPKKHF